VENCKHELVGVKECTKCGKTFDTIPPQSQPQTQEEWLSLEKQYAESLGRLAKLCDLVCPWVLDEDTYLVPGTVYDAATEIMEYVDSVRP
jgi:hypothetical protein